MKILKPWKTKNYYDKAKYGSETQGQALSFLKKYAASATQILDVGCGEGSRLSLLQHEGVQLHGIDASAYAIARAKKQYSSFVFKVANAEALPFKDASFDLSYSAFVFEHLANPEKVIEEMIRVTKTNGTIIIIAPNYGSPNRSSPVYVGNRMMKLLKGLFHDLFLLETTLSWNHVTPLQGEYEMDSDTLVEPYARTLSFYLVKKNLDILDINTCWEEELPNAKIHQKIFRFLGERQVYPFFYWGPHLIVIAKKRN